MTREQSGIFADGEETGRGSASTASAILEKGIEADELSRAVKFDETVIANIGEGLYTTDGKGMLVTINPAGEDILGWSAEELQGRRIHELIHHKHRDGTPIPSSDCSIYGVLETARPVVDRDDVFIRKDGSFIEVRYTAAPLVEDDRIIGLVVIFRNVSERRQIEARIRESEARLQAMFSQAGVGVCLIGPNGVFEQANPKFCEITGYDERELIGLSYPDITLPADQSAVRDKFNSLLTTDTENASLEKRIVRKDGSPVWVRVNLAKILERTADVLQVVAIVEDISERRLAEEKLRETERRFSLFMQHLPGLAWIKDSTGRYLYANEAAESAFGVSGDSLYGKTDGEIFPEKIARAFAQNDAAALESEAGIQVVETLVGPEGEKVESLVSKFAIPDYSGGRPLIGGMAVDITDQLRTQRDQEFLFAIAEMIRTSVKAADLLRTIPRLVGEYLGAHRCLFNEIDLDADTEIVHTDYARTGESVAGRHRISDYSPVMSEILKAGKTIVNRDSKIDPRTAELYDKVYRPSSERAYIAVPMMRNGRWVASLWCSDDKSRTWSNREIALLESIAERTWAAVERLRAEAALRHSEEMFSTLVDNAPFGVYMIDADFRLRSINAGSRAVFAGIEPLIGRDFAEVLRIVWDEPFATEAIGHFRHTLETGESFLSPPIVAQRGNIEEIQAYDWQIHRVTFPDGSLGVVCYFYDLTFQKRLEATVRRSAEMNAFRLKLADALRPLASPERIQATATRVLGEHLQAARVLYFEVRDGNYVIGDSYASEGVSSLTGVHPIENFGDDLLQTFRSGSVAVRGDIAADPVLSENEKAAFAAIEVRSYIGVPLVKDGELLAGLSVQSDVPREWTSDEVDLVAETAERTWGAVERARAEEALQISEENFRSLFESIDEGFVIIELIFDEGGKPVDYRYLRANPSYSRLTGLAGEAVGKTARETKPGLEEFWFETFGRVTRTGESVRFEHEAVSLGRWFDVYASRVGGDESRQVAIVFNDITDRKRVESALRESDERFQLAQSAGNVGVWDWDIIAGRTYWSDTMWRFYGEEPSSVNPDDAFWSLHLHPDDRRRVKEALYRCVESSDLQYRDEFRIIGAEGRVLWIASMANIIRRPDGKAVRFYGVNVDITERKINEERIKRNETQLRLVTDSVPALIAYVDNRERYQFVNRTYSEWLGMEPEAVIGRTVEAVIGPGAYRSLLPLIEKALRGEKVLIQSEIPYENAGPRFVQISYVPDVTRDGSVRGYFSLISDLTEAKRAEELLRSTEQRIALLMENVTDYAIFSIGTDGAVESWNTGAEKIFGYTAEEIIGRSSDILYTAEDAARGIPLNEMRTARQRGRANDERWYVRKDGSRFFASGVMMPLIVGKRLTGYAKIASDLTEKKRRAEELQSAHDELELRVFQRTRELAETNELLRTEVEQRKLSERHRVKLLHRIVSAQEAERKRIARDIHDQLGQRLTALRLKLASLHDIIEDKGIASRVERLQEIASLLDGEVSFLASELRPSILDDLGLEEALRAYARDWSHHFDIKLDFHSNGVLGRRFGREVETQLYRIAQEALNNVAKHSSATEVTVLMEQTAECLVLIVEDDGSGFDEAEGKKQGSKGLGLLGMKERAALIGAELEIESSLGSGTTIFLRLPNRKRMRSNER